MTLQTLLAALGLALLMEGALPFIAPGAWREAFRRMLEMQDGQVRFVGLLALGGGLALIWLSS
jgi:uncharacterized protein YjeT (DUF2065 family)